MRIAIPTWQANVSPVLDVAQRFLVADVEGSIEQRRRFEALKEMGVLPRATRLKAMSVNVLICGAVSLPLKQVLVSLGIKVVPHVCGSVDEVITAYLAGRLRNPAFLLPGCGWRHRCGRGRGSTRGRWPAGEFK